MKKRYQEIRQFNNQLLEVFEKDIEGLSIRMIRWHLGHVDFYINGYCFSMSQ